MLVILFFHIVFYFIFLILYFVSFYFFIFYIILFHFCIFFYFYSLDWGLGSVKPKINSFVCLSVCLSVCNIFFNTTSCLFGFISHRDFYFIQLKKIFFFSRHWSFSRFFVFSLVVIYSLMWIIHFCIIVLFSTDSKSNIWLIIHRRSHFIV